MYLFQGQIIDGTIENYVTRNKQLYVRVTNNNGNRYTLSKYEVNGIFFNFYFFFLSPILSFWPKCS